MGTLDKVARLTEWARAELDCSVTQLALAWCARNPNVTTVLLGATKVSQLEENLGAISVLERLTDGPHGGYRRDHGQQARPLRGLRRVRPTRIQYDLITVAANSADLWRSRRLPRDGHSHAAVRGPVRNAAAALAAQRPRSSSHSGGIRLIAPASTGSRMEGAMITSPSTSRAIFSFSRRRVTSASRCPPWQRGGFRPGGRSSTRRRWPGRRRRHCRRAPPDPARGARHSPLWACPGSARPGSWAPSVKTSRTSNDQGDPVRSTNVDTSSALGQRERPTFAGAPRGRGDADLGEALDDALVIGGGCAGEEDLDVGVAGVGPRCADRRGHGPASGQRSATEAQGVSHGGLGRPWLGRGTEP